MISALRKFARKNEDAKSRAANMPSGVTSMGQSLQRKFGRGVQYNMKIIIKGDRNTGKSTLLGRFQGKPFKEEYIPTNEIQVCSINWSYRVSDEVVKVEVWDVVDKGKKKSTGHGLKLANKLSTEDGASGVLDAEFLDVYKGTHGCIMMLDITKQWTFKYIERELPKIPDHIPVLVLANYLDMDEHRVVQLDEVISFINTLERGTDAAMVEYGECCMKNSFGLKFIHKFFNIPFLNLQRETLKKQLEVNEEDMKSTLEELSFHRDSEEQDYEKFLAYLEKKTKEKNQAQALENDLNASSSSPNLSSTSLKSPSVSKDKKVLPKSLKTSTPQKNSIDDFVPRDTIDLGFLGETEKEVEDHPASDDSGEGSDSENEGNPMVSGFQDISSTEEDGMEEATSSVAQQPNIGVDIEITSDEESEDEVVASVPVVQAKKKTDRVAVGNHKTAGIIEDKTLKTKNDDVINDESSSFMDAWLDSADINPPELKKSDVKSGTGLFGGNELDMFAASQLTSKTSYKPVAEGEEHDSSDDIEDEKKKRLSEKRNKEGEEGKHKHRSKHKHKKKSKVKEDEEEEEEEEENESAEKKTKSMKKHRHKKSQEKKQGGGGNYESF